MELAVIMAVIAQSGAIADVTQRLLPDMFTNLSYRLVYRAMTALYDHEADIDILSIEEEMRLLDPTRTTELNGLEFIADRMLTVRNAAHIRTYAASVIRCWVLRRLCADMQEHTLKAHDPAVDAVSLLGGIHKGVQKLEDFFAVSSTTREAGDVSRQVLAGRPSMGKTTLHSYLTIIETFTSVKKRTKNKFKTFSYYTAILFNIFGNCMAKIIVQQIAAVASDIASAE